MTHALKTWPEYYNEVVNRSKMFDLRKDDRPFKVGDTIILQEYIMDSNSYTGAEHALIITYILRDVPLLGLAPGFVILGLTEKEY